MSVTHAWSGPGRSNCRASTLAVGADGFCYTKPRGNIMTERQSFSMKNRFTFSRRRFAVEVWIDIPIEAAPLLKGQ
jgi:hypothetical protein